LYVYTLYDNLHGAQDKMGALLTSNDQDIATAKTFQAQDFPNTLNLADLPQITVEPQSVSYDAYTKAVQDLGNQMSQTYLDSYNNAKAAYAAMTAQLSTDIQTSKDAGDTWQNDARDWLNTANEYQTKQNEWEASVDGWLNGTAGVNPTLRTYQDDFLSMQASQQALTDNATILYGAIGNVTNLNAINTAMSNYSTALDTWSTAVDNYLASPTGSAPTRQDIRVPSVSNQTVDAIQTAYTNALKGLAGNTSDLQNIMNAHTAYIAAGGSSQTQVEDPLYPTGATTDAMNTLENDLNAILPYDSPAIPTIAQYSLETQYDTVSADLTAFNNNSDAVEQTAGTYDPLAYLTDADKAKVGSIISSYATELGVVQSALTTAQSNNIQQVTDAYNSYAKSTSDTRASVYQAYTDELQRVNAARDSLSSALQDTASTNKGLIGSFAGILPETRNGAQVNSKSAQFVANPVLLSQPDVRAAGNAAAFTLSSPWVLLIISVAILIAALVIRAVRNRRGEGGRHEARG
ncbi:MAG: hypothetical protein FWF33_08210, partial [Clostridiales bacterium]|nr:hypothetical protein [Clostridiales bacterium]